MVTRKALYWLLGAIGINRLCSLVPSYRYFDPFPFYDIVDAKGNPRGITVQSYIYGISQHVIFMVSLYLLCQATKGKLAHLFNLLFVVEILSLIDYLLIFEHPFFHLLGYSVEFTDIKVLLYAYLILTWTQQK